MNALTQLHCWVCFMIGANLNSIAQVKTVTLEGPKGPANAMMIAVNLNDPTSAEEFVQQVAEQFKVHRMLAPPDTSMLLITIVGEMSADLFARRWNEIGQRDEALRAFMAKMAVADVVQGTKSGQQLSKASLLHSPGGRPTSLKPWWKFW
jgi:hypothetical protein